MRCLGIRLDRGAHGFCRMFQHFVGVAAPPKAWSNHTHRGARVYHRAVAKAGPKELHAGYPAVVVPFPTMGITAGRSQVRSHPSGLGDVCSCRSNAADGDKLTLFRVGELLGQSCRLEETNSSRVKTAFISYGR